MKVGIIGSGSIGPDLAYGFASKIAASGGTVTLVDIDPKALERGMARIRGYAGKGLRRGKLSARAAKAVEAAVTASVELQDLAGCDYVLEAATENLDVKRSILKNLEEVVSDDCLIGFATSGLPRALIAAETRRPQRCFVNHPFFPAWRSQPIEVVLSEDSELSQRMVSTLRLLGKVPIATADVPCFAADDIFCNYCAEAARIVEEGLATPEQVDAIVDAAIGGGGPFRVMDLTRGNLLNAHCLELMKEGPEGTDWFTPPEIFRRQANEPWLDADHPGEASYDAELGRIVLDRILAVLLGRTCWVIENGVCDATRLNWLTRTALGFRAGLVDVAWDLGPEKLAELCNAFAEANPGFEVVESIRELRPIEFRSAVEVSRDQDLAVVSIFRPEVSGALNDRTMGEIVATIDELVLDESVRGVVLTSFDGSIAGADIGELAALENAVAAAEKCRRGHRVLATIAAASKPVVAALDGPVLGGGAELAMACHARVVGKHLMLGQPEVNLGIIPGYGGTQRLARLVGLEKGLAMLRSGAAINAAEACACGWASGEPAESPVDAAKALLRRHLDGQIVLEPIDPAPMEIPSELPTTDIGHHSRAIDEILVEVVRDGLARPMAEGLELEAEAFARCRDTVDADIGLSNFMTNGPRTPAVFLHE